MCILAFAWKAHPRWRLVAAGNRDELHARPAAPLARWEEPGHALAGRDLQSGGTWLGVSEQGRFAVVTNLRGYGPPEPGRPSRGALAADLLSGRGAYADIAVAALSDFNPFNLIAVDGEAARFLSNRPAETRADLTRADLGPGIYGLSNGALDEPWPKTVQLKGFLLEWLVAGAAEPRSLLDGLRSETLFPAGLPPDRPSDAPQEPPLSPIFIRGPVYGTRCSSVVAVDAQGRGLIVERRFGPDGEAAGETALAFSWPA